VESSLRSMSVGTRGDGLQMEGGWACSCRNRTMSHAIPEEMLLEGVRGSQCEDESEDPCP
jgi:hypothetical protein